MSILAYFILIIYTIALLYITIYCLMQLNLLYYYKRGKRVEGKQNGVKNKASNGKEVARKMRLASVPAKMELKQQISHFDPVLLEEQGDEYPFVTIQLPIFNDCM